MKKTAVNNARECFEMWDSAEKTVIADNIKKFLTARHPECASFDARIAELEKITGSKRQTVYAWLNRSRKNVKVPFLKFCMIAENLGVDAEDLCK